VAAIGKLFMTVAGVTEAVVLEVVATPVMSSMRASWPAARFEFEVGKLTAVVTGRVPVLARFRVREEPVSTREFARLMSISIPALPVIAWEVEIVEVKGPGNEATHTVFARHGWFKLVIVTPVPLKNASVALEKVTVNEV
jgi:hypothetical protein